MKILVTIFAVITMTVVLATEPPAPLTEEQEKTILQYFLLEACRRGPTKEEQIIAYVKTEKISDAQMTNFVLKMLDELFKKKTYDKESKESRYLYAACTLRLLLSYNPGKEETQKLLKNLIKDNPLKETRGNVVMVYVKLYGDTLVDDPYIDEQMTTNGYFDRMDRFPIFRNLMDKYETETAETKQKIVDRIYQWAQFKVNMSDFSMIDPFLLKYKSNYAKDPCRKKLLEMNLKELDESNSPKNSPGYRYTSSELKKLQD